MGIHPAGVPNDADSWFGFADLTTLRQLHTALLGGGAFRAVLRDLQAARAGQLAFDFRLDAHQARIVELPARRSVGPAAAGEPAAPTSRAEAGGTGVVTPAASPTPERPLNPAEQCS